MQQWQDDTVVIVSVGASKGVPLSLHPDEHGRSVRCSTLPHPLDTMYPVSMCVDAPAYWYHSHM